MEIPTREDRIQSLYGDQIERYTKILNEAILTGSESTDNKGYPYITAMLEPNNVWVNSDIIKYLDEHYRKAGWLLEQNTVFWETDKYEIHIFRYKADEE